MISDPAYPHLRAAPGHALHSDNGCLAAGLLRILVTTDQTASETPSALLLFAIMLPRQKLRPHSDTSLRIRSHKWHRPLHPAYPLLTLRGMANAALRRVVRPPPFSSRLHPAVRLLLPRRRPLLAIRQLGRPYTPSPLDSQGRCARLKLPISLPRHQGADLDTASSIEAIASDPRAVVDRLVTPGPKRT